MLQTLFSIPTKGVLRTDPVPEEAEDAAASISATENLSEEEQEELRRELAKVRKCAIACVSKAYATIIVWSQCRCQESTVYVLALAILARGEEREEYGSCL